jgi:two-component system alkaline phosphatase synthesis response regulator PhoP
MSKPQFRILVVDDEPDIVEFLSYNLKREGYSVYSSSNGKDAIEMAKKCFPHLIILDVMMPGMDGVEACEQLRSIESLKDTIITFLTARSENYSQIAGFKAGADDYITKPVDLKILMSRIKALLRRIGETSRTPSFEPVEPKMIHGSLEIDSEKHVVIKDGTEIQLPRKEFKLLLMLSNKPGKVFTRESILSNIWSDNVIVGGRTIDVHIRKLRSKIGNHHFVTIKGVGYKFVE